MAKSKWRIIYYDDSSEALMCGPGKMSQPTLEGWVKRLAGTQVDAVSWVAGIPDVCYFDTRVGEVFGSGHDSLDGAEAVWAWQLAENLRSLVQSGKDPLSIMCESCHRHGIDLIAAFRMNDEHAIAQADDPLSSRFLLEHLDWRVAGRRGALDYSVPEVQEHRFRIIEEAVERYDVDGIELDWMRWGVMFPAGTERERAPMLTRFVARIREMLDRNALRKGKERIRLGTRVAPTLEATEAMGIDLRSWIDGDLLDYLIPSDFYYTDFNMPVESFKELARGSRCLLYPCVHPMLSTGDTRPLSEANLRAAAHNYFEAGADGVSMYNFFVGQLSLPGSYIPSALIRESWEIASRAIREIGDPRLISAKPRHYVYHPLWPADWPKAGGPGSRCHVARLSRKDPGNRVAFRFRMMEDLASSGAEAILRFKVVNMTAADLIEIDVNGTPVPGEEFARSHWGRGRCYGYGRDLFSWYQYELRLGSPPGVRGDNEIGFRVLKTAPRISFGMTVEEVEVEVR